jgi:hypothetical protein
MGGCPSSVQVAGTSVDPAEGQGANRWQREEVPVPEGYHFGSHKPQGQSQNGSGSSSADNNIGDDSFSVILEKAAAAADSRSLVNGHRAKEPTYNMVKIRCELAAARTGLVATPARSGSKGAMNRAGLRRDGTGADNSLSWTSMESDREGRQSLNRWGPDGNYGPPPGPPKAADVSLTNMWLDTTIMAAQQSSGRPPLATAASPTSGTAATMALPPPLSGPLPTATSILWPTFTPIEDPLAYSRSRRNSTKTVSSDGGELGTVSMSSPDNVVGSEQ